jgi:hypothetical protein
VYLSDGQPAHDGVPLKLCQYPEIGEYFSENQLIGDSFPVSYLPALVYTFP